VVWRASALGNVRAVLAGGGGEVSPDVVPT
jgi:hypothetical protein